MGGMLLMCQNITMRAYGARIKRYILRFMFKTYSSSSSLVITSRWFATSRLVLPVSVRLVYSLWNKDVFLYTTRVIAILLVLPIDTDFICPCWSVLISWLLMYHEMINCLLWLVGNFSPTSGTEPLHHCAPGHCALVTWPPLTGLMICHLCQLWYTDMTAQIKDNRVCIHSFKI